MIMDRNKIGGDQRTSASGGRETGAPRRALLSALAALVLGGLTLVACQEEPSRPVASEELREVEGNVIFDVLHFMTSDGVREARVVADTAYTWRDSTSMALRQLELTVFNETGGERAVVTALRGLLDRGSNRMVARGDVVLLIRDGGRRVESAELHYDPDQDRIWSDSATVYYAGDRIVEGTGFVSDTEFQDVRVENGRTRGGVSF